MTKENLNNTPLRYTFSRDERLKSRKTIASLFRKRSYFVFNNIKVFYKKEKHSTPAPSKVGFSVPKAKFKKAIHRNLLKRKLREAYRLNKHIILSNKNERFDLMFVYQDKEIQSWASIHTSIQKLLLNLSKA